MSESDEKFDDYGIPVNASNEEKIAGIMNVLRHKSRLGIIAPKSPPISPTLKKRDKKYYEAKQFDLTQ